MVNYIVSIVKVERMVLTDVTATSGGEFDL